MKPEKHKFRTVVIVEEEEVGSDCGGVHRSFRSN